MSSQKKAYEMVFGKGTMQGNLSVPMPFFTDAGISKMDTSLDGAMPILLQNVAGNIDVASGKRSDENTFDFVVERTKL